MRLLNRPLGVLAAAAGLALAVVPGALANHPVYVEGNCFGPGAAQRTIVPVGTCGDYDGDGRIGIAEDNDEPDRIFGTLNAALGPGLGAAAGTGANQNGSVTIVSSGVFAEIVTITAANGNVTLQGAPGVEATIDAIVQGTPGGAARQLAPGVIVDAPVDRRVTIRNVMSRNWAEGYRIQGDSHVTLEDARAENNTNWGIRVVDRAQVAISNSSVYSTGYRVGAGTDFPRVTPPVPGIGVAFEGSADGTVCFSTVTGSFRDGIANNGTGNVTISHDNVFDNNPDVSRRVDAKLDCIGTRGNRGDDDDDDDSVVPLPGGAAGAGLVVLLLAGAALLIGRTRRAPRTV